MDETPVIGIDGGGTGCRVALVCAGRRVEAEGGPANVWQDEARALTNLSAVLRDAAQRAGLGHEALAGARVHAGLAGVLDAGDAARVSSALAEAAGIAPPGVSDDRVTTLEGALGPGDGWLLSVGTGSFAGCRVAGARRFVGGWGLRLGDQASGAWLGRRALEASLLVHDGIEPPGVLSWSLLADFSNDPKAVVDFSQVSQSSAYAAYAPRVAAAAESGDPLGRRLMEEGAAYLQQALTALEYPDKGALCLVGGLGSSYARYLPEALRRAVVAPQGSALNGALALAAARSEDGA